MKKTIGLALLLTMASIQFASAAEQVAPLVPATSMEEMMNLGVATDDVTEVADFDRDHDRDRDRDHGRDRDRDHGRFGVVCYAKNARGIRFEARGRSSRDAQFEAMRQCERQSRRCFELGCRRG